MTEEQINLLALLYEAVTFGGRVGEQMEATALQFLVSKPNRVCKNRFSVQWLGPVTVITLTLVN